MALKEHKFYEAERYLAARSQGLECGVTYCQEERLETIDGDFCIVRFDTAPIRGASVKTVFDALLGSVLNAETFLSDMFGSITIREDSELESPEIAQLRLVSLTSSAALVESNTVVFSKLSEDANGEYGVMAQDFVDYDELYPYRSNERVRRDTTTIVVVRLTPQIPGKPPVVVVTRWTYLKVHNSNMVVQNPESEIKESSVCWGDTAQKCMQHIMDTATLNSPHVA
ncbi:hypothetical protein PHMEG_00011105 [Phytophthora megakarya]|uniref:Uncharacterized protein n=1 Tax=Phytophthora megakarya TaxID=4795 RepID=A0A225WDH2_9STRA|nr:hypothetical protein PHMEG_00011105 [Phytophthora megakarya]